MTSRRAEEAFKIPKIHRDCLLMFLEFKSLNFHCYYIRTSQTGVSVEFSMQNMMFQASCGVHSKGQAWP